MFTVYRPDSITFNPDTGATDILIRQQDSTILTHLVYYTNAEPAPAFHVANHTSIYPTAVGRLHIPNTDINLTAYVFPDDDLADNLFGLAPLLNHGCTATFTQHDCSVSGPAASGHPIILYGTKSPFANAWQFSLPKPHPHHAHQVIHHETHAELVLFASAVFGNPTVKTLSKALRLGWLSNYPDLTCKMLTANKPHSPATGLGHITASRSNVRSTRGRAFKKQRSTYIPEPQFLTQPSPTANDDSSLHDSMTLHSGEVWVR